MHYEIKPLPLVSEWKLINLAMLCLTLLSRAQDTPIYKDPTQSTDARAKDLVSRLTLDEKVYFAGLSKQSRTAFRDIPAYNWWNEALHGVARAGEATIFPQAIGMAATFNDSLLRQVSTANINRSKGEI